MLKVSLNGIFLDLNDAKMTEKAQKQSDSSVVVLAETFERHWDQLKGITNNVRIFLYKNVLRLLNEMSLEY